MNTDDFKIQILTDKSRINEIHALRICSWEKSENAHLLKDEEFINHINNDTENDYQFIIEDNNRIAAAVRIQLLYNFENKCKEYKDFSIPSSRPFGDYERLVVHPDYRGLGLVNKIDRHIIKFANEIHLPFLITEVLPPRDKTIIRYGYHKLGGFTVEKFKFPETKLYAISFIVQF